jgi:hypothetical protein
MKKVLILFFLLQAFILHAQNLNIDYNRNSTSASIFYYPIPVMSIGINQERYFKKNMSFDIRLNYLSYKGDITYFNITSIIFGPKWYFSAPRNNFCSYWIHPSIIWRYENLNSTNGESKLDSYHVGTTIGKRHFIIQDTFFWDIGIGVSYGIGIYRFYKKFDTEGHDNIYEFHPRFICNFGWKY